MMRRWFGIALLAGWTVAITGCGGSKIENKPNFQPQQPPPPASKAETGGQSNPTKIAQ